MRSLLGPILLSFVLHALLFGVVTQIKADAAPKKRDPVRMRVVEKPKPKPPPPPPPPEEKKPEPKPKPKPKPEPKPEPKKIIKKPEPKPEAPPEPEPPKPEPPPVFSVDMSKTVSTGPGPAVRAVEGGGNMFADPKTEGDATKKQKGRTPPPSGNGSDLNGGAGSFEPPKFSIPRSARTPPYPRQARRQGIEGQVVLRTCIDESGRVGSVKVMKSLGYGCDEIATEWARTKWKFTPAKRGGVPIPYCITAPVTFELD